MVWERNTGLEPNDILQNRFTAYVSTAVHRKKIEYIDRKVKEQYFTGLDDYMIIDFDFNLEKEALKNLPVELKLQNEELFLAISKLTDRERYVFFKRTLDEKSMTEIANELGMAYKSVAAVYYRTLEKLRKNMRGDKV